MYFLDKVREENKFQLNDIDIKKDLIKKVGQAKQCLLCKRIFSSEYKAIDHIHEDHKNIQLNDVEQILGKSLDSKKSFRKNKLKRK